MVYASSEDARVEIDWPAAEPPKESRLADVIKSTLQKLDNAEAEKIDIDLYLLPFKLQWAKRVSNGRCIKRYELGDRKLNQAQKSILVVGPSGHGKTRFINTLFNYLMGVHFDDDFRFVAITDKQQAVAEGQTSSINVYVVHESLLNFRFVVIDTPGFGDTSGAAFDDDTKKLFDVLFNMTG